MGQVSHPQDDTGLTKAPANAPSGTIARPQEDAVDGHEVPVLSPDGQYGYVQVGQLDSYLAANPGSKFPDRETIAAKEAEREAAEELMRDPFGVERRENAAQNATIDQADSALGLGAIAGLGAFAGPFGPGVAVLAGQDAAKRASGGVGSGNPLAVGTRFQMGQLDPLGVTTATMKATGGLFGAPEDGGALGQFINQQRRAPGYGDGQNVAAIGLGEAAGLSNAMSALGSVGSLAAAGAVENATMNAVQTGTSDYLENRPLSWQKIAASAKEGAILGLVPAAIAGAGGVTARGVRRLGELNELQLGRAPNEIKIDRALEKNGQRFEGPGGVKESIKDWKGGLHTEADIAHNLKATQDAISRESFNVSKMRQSAEFSRLDVSVPAAELRGELEHVARETMPAAQEFQYKKNKSAVSPELDELGQRSVFESRQQTAQARAAAELRGATKFLEQVERIGDVKPKDLRGLKSFADSGRMTPLERPAAVAMYRRLESKMVGAMAQSGEGPAFRNLAAAQARLDGLGAVSTMLQQSKASGMAKGFKFQTGNLTTGLGLLAVVGGHPGALATAVASIAKDNLAEIGRTIAPTALAGARLAEQVQRTTSALSDAGKLMARGFSGSREPRAVKTPRLNEEKTNAILGEMKKLLEGPNADHVATADQGLASAAEAHAQLVAGNIMARVKEAGYSAPGFEPVPLYGAFGGIAQGRGGKARKGNSLIAQEQVSQYIGAAIAPMAAINGIASLDYTREELRSVKENYPDLFLELRSNMIQELVQNPPPDGMDLESQAKFHAITGEVTSLATDPSFATDLPMLIAPPEGAVEGEGGRAGNPRITETSEMPDIAQSETDRIERM